MIDELNKGRECLLSQAPPSRLLLVLRKRLQSITRNMYIFDGFPEQCEDIYCVLVDGRTVVQVEIPRDPQEAETVFETWSVEEYLKARKSVTKTGRRKFQLALELAQGAERPDAKHR